jgi:microcystin-dependent protein
MSQPYLGEIRFFGGNFAPRNNALAAGQILSIQQNTALFSLLGTFYGGNGTTTFALPDLRGRLPIGQGQGPGLTDYTIGESLGTESVTITQQTTPSHTHSFHMTNVAATNPTPAGNLPATLLAPFTGFYVKDANKTGNPVTYSPQMVQTSGGSQPHENRMPAMAITIIIALAGIFPSRN